MMMFCGIIVSLLVGLNLVTSVYIPPGPKYTCPVKKSAIYPCKCDRGSDIGLYITCDGGNLANLAVAFENLAGLDSSKVEEVLIKNSNFLKLYGTIFHKSNTRSLIIENVPIKSIDQFTFYGINTTLEELRLINTSLTEFPKDSFKVLGNLKYLEINYHQITILNNYEFDDSQIAAKLEKMLIVNGNITEMGANAFQHLKKLKVIDLHGNQIGVLKKNQFRGLRDAEVLDISHNEIAKLDSSHISDLTKLSFCNASHNHLTELTRGAFARNAVLRVLNLSYNNIKRLDANSLRGMRFLRRLYLSDNAITDVGRGTFGSITRIGTIDLARNQLKKIEYQMFAQLNYVEILDLAENNITEIQKQSFTDLYLTTINISYNSLSKIEANSFVNCANITLLDFSHNLLESIPKQSFDSNTYATALDLSYNRFSNMSQIPLQNMTGIKVLNVSFNEITEIPRNTFPKLYELHTIDASHNMIKDIANAVFTPLFSLRNLNLSHNSLEKIKPSTFGTMATLLDLDLSDNELKDVSRGSFAKLQSCRFLTVENNQLESMFQLPISLNHLNFRNNSVKEIPEKTWPVMNALLSLDLAHNEIENNLRGYSFLGLLTLQTLNLNSNGVSQIPYESLSELKTLQYIHLESNNITELPKSAFGKLPVVFEVNLYNNNIKNISKKAFDGLLQLLTLNLSQNAIQTIPPEAFFGLVSLRKMDLSHNSLEKLDNKTNSIFEDCLSLNELNLSHNKISFITRKMFPSNPWIPYRLEKVDLSFNAIPVLTFDLTFGTRKLKQLNVSHNFINDIRKYVLGNLTSLEVLDLSFNSLSDFQTSDAPFNLPENITHLYMQNNKIFRIDYEKITDLSNIVEVNLENNDLLYLNKTMIDAIKANVTVRFAGNPLTCSCEIRPLQHFLSSQSSPPALYEDLVCAHPKHLTGVSLKSVEDKQLTCSDIEKDSIPEFTHEYEILPDIRFRDIMFTKKTLFIQYFVSSMSKDIADFYLHLKDEQNKVLYEKTLAYDTRIGNITSETLEKIDFEQKVVLCIFAKNSEEIILTFDENQCIQIPKNFNTVMKKYNKRPSTFFKIFEMDKKNIGRNAIALSSATKFFANLPLTALLSLISFYLFA